MYGLREREREKGSYFLDMRLYDHVVVRLFTTRNSMYLHYYARNVLLYFGSTLSSVSLSIIPFFFLMGFVIDHQS